MRYSAVFALLAFLQVQLCAQGTLRLQPFGGQPVEIPVFPLLAQIPATTQVYLVTSGGSVLVPLLPTTTMRPDPAGVSRVEPVQVNLAGIPVASPATFRIRVWDASTTYDVAGPFGSGSSPDFTLDFQLANSYIISPALVIIPEPTTPSLLLLGGTAIALLRRFSARV